jgi:hypothetical protein
VDSSTSITPAVNPEVLDQHTAFDRWYWYVMLEVLDRAGYVVIKKPELIDRGRPASREW